MDTPWTVMSIRASAGLKTALVSDGVGVHLVSLKRYCWMMLVLVFTGVCAAPQSKQTAPCLLNLSQVTQICTQMLKKHTALLLLQSLPTFAELFFLISLKAQNVFDSNDERGSKHFK